VTRSITLDGGFRVMAARTTDLVRDAVRVQQLTGPDARAFADLLTGAVLVRETMAPGHRVQIILSNEGRGSLIADSHASHDGAPALTRGLANRGDVAGPLLGEGGVLKVIRSLPRGLHQSIVAATQSGVSEALMSYMQESEQVFATLAVASVMDGDRVVAAGGYVVQLLPELKEAPLAIMTERLAHDFASLAPLLLAHDADPKWLMDELLYGFPHEQLARQELTWGCDCSQARVLGAMATLGAAELQSIVLKGEVLELTCEYCTTRWSVGPEQLRTLLQPS